MNFQKESRQQPEEKSTSFVEIESVMKNEKLYQKKQMSEIVK